MAKPLSGAVYNLGGGKANSISILESIDRIAQLWVARSTGRSSDQVPDRRPQLSLHRSHALPVGLSRWSLTMSIDDILLEDFARVSFSGSAAA